MFRAFMDFAAVAPGDTILDIGATSDRLYDHSNYFEAWYQCKRSVTAVGLDDAAFLAQQYPGLRFLRADGRDLPFTDASFDYVHSGTALEHVGPAAPGGVAGEPQGHLPNDAQSLVSD